MNGSEWVVEAHGCDPWRLGDLRSLELVFEAAVRELALNPVAPAQWHQFPEPGGVTGMLMLAESHVTLHTFPEHASLCMNLFCCTPRREWEWGARLAELVGAQEVRVRRLDRVFVSEGGSMATEGASRPELQRLPSPVSRLPSPE